MARRSRTLVLAPLVFALACASPPTPRAASPERGLRSEAVRHAAEMIGAPYRFGGSSPHGFDCSGLVVYSYRAAGLGGLPHSAAALERRARPVDLDRLEPGDLLFFDLEGKKAAHVAIYLGDEAFIHAPSPGKRVERVAFDHVYWGDRIRRAGRIAD